MKRLILVGSPRTNGRSGHLAEELFENLIEDCPEDELFLVPISEIEVLPCINCGACEKTSEVIMKDDEGNDVSLQKHRCIFDDDMQSIYDIIDEADEIIVVCPVFFSGAPGPFKCLLDRLQPYFWSKARLSKKRPATLHIVGEGGDPHGYAALMSEVRSALAVAGFRLERVLDWVGKISADGEIKAEAEEVILDSTSLPKAANQKRDMSSPEHEKSGAKQTNSNSSSKSKASVSQADTRKSLAKDKGTSRPKLKFTKTKNTSTKSTKSASPKKGKSKGSQKGARRG